MRTKQIRIRFSIKNLNVPAASTVMQHTACKEALVEDQHLFRYGTLRMNAHFPITWVLLLCSVASTAAQAHAPLVEQEIVVEAGQAWDGSPWAYPQASPHVTLLRLRIPPNTTLGWHQHPMLNVAYVERGAITVERHHDSLQRSFNAGSAITEMMNVTHRGHTGADGAELLIFYAGAPGMPLSVPLP